MRLGAPVHSFDSPEAWVLRHKEMGYTAAYFPLNANAASCDIASYAKAANASGIIIAEVGAWSNPIDPDKAKREAAIKLNIEQLSLADEVGARCCVNVSGSRNPLAWAGPSPLNLTSETFDRIVDTVRLIIDSVNPQRTFYTLECMPWAYPDSADSYLKLIDAIDRKQFAVHLDPCNLVNNPNKVYNTRDLLNECYLKLGKYIKSIHVKDVRLEDTTANVTINEVLVGTGSMDISSLLAGAHILGDVPLMLEHLPSHEDYVKATNYIKEKALELGLRFE